MYRVAVMTFVELFSEQKHELLSKIGREAIHKELILSDRIGLYALQGG